MMIGTGWTVAAIAATSTVTGAISYTVLKRQEQRQVVAGPTESVPPIPPIPHRASPSPPPPPGHEVALASVAPPPLPLPPGVAPDR